jgi:hypothetical protein
VAETDGPITFVVDSYGRLYDGLYAESSDVGQSPPTYNERYEIYQCLLIDPEGRRVEIQVFG